MKWVWQRGTDTATGQEVGLIYNLPSWSVSNRGRVAELDRIVSKHLLVEARQGKSHVLFLVLHLVRPIGNQTGKHREQISAVGAWMQRTTAANPLAAVVVLGDTNSALTAYSRHITSHRRRIPVGRGTVAVPRLASPIAIGPGVNLHLNSGLGCA